MTDDQPYIKSAKYYDMIYSSKSAEMYDNTIVDIEMIAADLLKRPLLSIIDLGCGTGTHALRLAEKGCEVLGVDLSPHQLNQARKKAEQKGLEIEFLEADMREIPVKDRQFDAAAAFFSGFCYLLDDEAVLEFLHEMDRWVREDGFVYFEFWNALALNPDNIGLFETSVDSLHLLRTNTVEYNVMTGVVTMPMRHLIWEGDRVIDDFTETHQLRMYTIPQLQALVEQTKWNVHEIFSGFYNKGPEERNPKREDFRYYALLTRA